MTAFQGLAIFTLSFFQPNSTMREFVQNASPQQGPQGLLCQDMCEGHCVQHWSSLVFIHFVNFPQKSSRTHSSVVASLTGLICLRGWFWWSKLRLWDLPLSTDANLISVCFKHWAMDQKVMVIICGPPAPYIQYLSARMCFSVYIFLCKEVTSLTSLYFPIIWHHGSIW